MIMEPKIQLFFLYILEELLTDSLASDKTIAGISLMEAVINKGTIIKSSNNPRTGIKSGIKSIGLNKYPTVIPIRTFAVTGVRLSLYASINTCASDFNCLAFCFSFCKRFMNSSHFKVLINNSVN